MRPPGSTLVPLLVASALAAGCRSTDVRVSSASSTGSAPETSQAQAQPIPLADSVGKKFETWLAGINSADRAQMERVWTGAANADGGVSLDVALAERSGGLELHHVEEATDSELLAVVRAKKTERWLCLTFDVGSDPPHPLQTISLRPTDAPSGPDGGRPSRPPFDDKARGQIVDAVVRELNRAYVFPEKATAMDRELHTRQRQHAYDAMTSRLTFARALTEDMQRMTHDKHLHMEVACSQAAGRPGLERRNPSPPAAADRKPVFGPTRRLEGNVAYIDIATFDVPGEQSRAEIRATMSQAADASAIIFDVRHNGGGEPETVALVSSYLFGSDPVHLNSLYWRIPDRTDDFFTDPRVEGPKFGPAKPVYILTSGRTFSAAEEFAYDLQVRKRAVVVGETTGGGAHPGDMVSMPHGFTVFVPNGRAINPITHTDWEGSGVPPDVPVPADKALETAHQLALAKAAPTGAVRRDGGAGGS